MKFSKTIVAVTLAVFVAVPAISMANEYQQMPMMSGPYGQQPMMDPAMMQRMMQMRQQQMQQMQQMKMPAFPANEPAVQEQAAVENIAPVTDEKYAGCKYHKGSMHNKSQMMEMMQAKQAMMQAHMEKVEAHLANIEALMQKMVDSRL